VANKRSPVWASVHTSFRYV